MRADSTRAAIGDLGAKASLNLAPHLAAGRPESHFEGESRISTAHFVQTDAGFDSMVANQDLHLQRFAGKAAPGLGIQSAPKVRHSVFEELPRVR